MGAGREAQRRLCFTSERRRGFLEQRTCELDLESEQPTQRTVWELQRMGTARAKRRRQETPTSREGVGVVAVKDLGREDGGLETRSMLRKKGLVLVHGIWTFACKQYRRTEKC